MIIDCHTHLGRNEHIKSNVKDLLDSMDKSGIDKSLVFAGELFDLSTSEMLKEIKPHRDRLYGVASYDFNYSITNRGCKSFQREHELVDLYKSGDIVAVKFYTGYFHKMPDDLRHVLWRLNQVGCPAIFHMGDCLNSIKCAKLKYAHPLGIDEVAVDFPDMNFIIAHMGYPWVRDAAEVCYKNANVYADMSGFVYGDFDGSSTRLFSNSINSFLDIAGNGNLLFGSDWPISNQDSYVKTVELLFNQSLCPAAEHLSQNTMKAFKL